MNEKRKVWLGVSSALLVSTGASAISQEAPAMPVASVAMSGMMAMGEAEMAAAEVDLTTDDPAFIAQLGLVRGHLWVGMKLFEEGHLDMAKTHMKHPGDELYAQLEPAFKARNLPGFAEELSALADSMNADAAKADIEKHYQVLQEAIAKNEKISEKSAADVLRSASIMLNAAAGEYAMGIENGAVKMVHEYQDSLGFTEVVIARFDELNESEQKAAAQEISKAKEYLEVLMPMWPTTNPQGDVEGEPSKIYATATRIEFLANRAS